MKANPEKDTPEEPRGKLVLITGLAGAGYSTALNALEDVGYLAVDNLPIALVDKLVSIEVETAGKKVAVSIDGRTSGFDSSRLDALVDDLRRRLEGQLKLVYLTASRDELFRRYNATRRHHPLNTSGEAEGLMAALELDGERMAPLERLADASIDTTASSPADFRQTLLASLDEAGRTHLPVLVQSFSYRLGIPANADMVIDMRFLENPHWAPGLAEQTGRDEAVQAFIRKDPAFAPYIDGLSDLLAQTLPRFTAEGRPQFSIATGCTGGRHRSVFAAITIAERLEQNGYPVRLMHRDSR